ncbi:hypothetical protein V8C37DRAFT_155872 [Trichoderma ceciliae]
MHLLISRSDYYWCVQRQSDSLCVFSFRRPSVFQALFLAPFFFFFFFFFFPFCQQDSKGAESCRGPLILLVLVLLLLLILTVQATSTQERGRARGAISQA